MRSRSWVFDAHSSPEKVKLEKDASRSRPEIVRIEYYVRYCTAASTNFLVQFVGFVVLILQEFLKNPQNMSADLQWLLIRVSTPCLFLRASMLKT